VRDYAAIDRVVQATFEAFGMVHIVRNNAGVNGAAGADNISLQDWSWVIDINLMGVVHGVKAFVLLLKGHGEGGRIVNTACLSQRRKPAAKAFALYPSCESRGSDLRSRDDWG
jgi:NAD(P)-dependent dehydrogenase (short-subunit alcohol dehydrogenase family)